jgi:putative nucleotidyltransferase with HDIG domain
LHEETVRRLENLQTLRVVDQAIAASFSLYPILDTVITHTLARLGADAADVLLLNPTLRTLEYAAGRGFQTRDSEQTKLRLGQGFAGRAALERRVFHVVSAKEALQEPRFLSMWNREGLSDYYCVPLIAKGEIKGVLEVFRRASHSPDPEWLDFLETLAGQAAIAIDNSQLFENLQHANLDLAVAYDANIEGWSRALDLRDKETEGHTQRVTELAVDLAKAIGLRDEELVHIRRGALLHDIGKMGVPDSILLKAGSLTKEERIIIERHPQQAYDLLAPIAYLRNSVDVPYCHHEKWDGTGYPRGLKAEQIPLAARIFAIVDVYDALISDRPYRQAWTKEKTLELIREQRGKHFDPRVADIFLELAETFSV